MSDTLARTNGVFNNSSTNYQPVGLLPKWFAKLLAQVWLVGLVFLFVSALNSQVVNMQMIDVGLGLLQSGQTSMAQEVFDKLTKPLGLGGVKVYAACGTPCPTIVLNLNEILNKALKQAVSALINSVMSALMGLFDKLMQAIEQAIRGFEGLADALGSFKAAIYMKAQDIFNSLNESASAFVDRVFPLQSEKYRASPELKALLENAVAARDLLVSANLSQQGVLVPVPNTPTRGQIEQLDQKIQQVVASGCRRPKLLGNGTERLLGVQCGAAITDGVTIANELAARDAAIGQVAKLAEKNILDQAPADCQGKGYLNITPASVDFSNGGSGSGFASASSFTSGTNFTTSMKVFVNTFDPKVLTPEECNNLDRGPATLAAAQAQANQSNNEFDFNSILEKFLQALTKFFTQLIEKVIGLITSAINNFLSKIPGGRYFSDALGNITNSIVPTIKNTLEQTANALFNINNPSS
jgi:hypothetical protein